jgi:polar amino acid transport system substrate-binding protein
MRWALLASLFLSAVSLGAEPLKLRVMTDVWPPFRIAVGPDKLQGLDIDLLEKLTERTGIRFEIIRAPWARGLAALESGSADMMTGLAKTAAREAYVQYSDKPYYACSARFYAKPSRAMEINTYGQLKGLKIGYVQGSAYFEPFDSDTSLNKVAVNSEKQLLEMLKRGRIQLLIGTDCQVDYELRDTAWRQVAAKAAYRPESPTHLYLGFSRKRLNPQTFDALSAALQQLREEGWVTQAAERYHVQVE